MTPRYPDCVHCNGKCFQWHDEGELVQKCMWCNTVGRALLSVHTIGGRQWRVRTWERRAL